jgi:hypothetical protein
MKPLDTVGKTWYNGHMENNRHAPVLRRMLRQGKTVYVEFIKQDGSIRRMLCTTNMTKIPFCKHPVGNGFEYDESQIRVFDLVKQDWRSMVEDNIEMVSTVD